MPRPSTPLDRVIPVHGATGPTFAQPHAVGAGSAVWTCWDSPSPYPKNDPRQCHSQVWGNAVIWFYLKIGYSQIHWIIIIFPKQHGHCGGVPQLKTYLFTLFLFFKKPSCFDSTNRGPWPSWRWPSHSNISRPQARRIRSRGRSAWWFSKGRLWTLDTLISEVTLYKYIHYIYIIVIP